MLGKKLRTEDDRIKAAAKARKKKRKKMIKTKYGQKAVRHSKKGCLFLYLCSSDCLPGDRHDPLFVYE